MFGVEPYPFVATGFPLAGFALAVWVTIDAVGTWRRGVIPARSLAAVQELSLSALNEGQFDEVGRLMRINTRALRALPEDALLALFDRKLVEEMVKRRNYAHLELLGNESAFGTRRATLTGVDIVSHVLLHADPSPVTSVIVETLGGDDMHAMLASEEELAKRTYGNWRWYVAARAAHSMAVVGHEALISGRYDDDYNLASFHYQTPNATSGRIKCPAYRAVALHYLALEEAQRHGVIDGADPNDFFSVFKAAFARSRVTPAWDEPNVPSDTPTPFAYLMDQTMRFLQSLARDGYAHAMGDRRFRDEAGNDIPVPAQAQAVFKRTCESWALCVWFMTTHVGRVPDRFVLLAILEYMNETLQFGFEHGRTAERTAYAEVAAEEFERHMHNARLSQLTRDAFERLDLGKRYVYEGRDWLRDQLGLGENGG
jgi:hypothetical protein